MYKSEIVLPDRDIGQICSACTLTGNQLCPCCGGAFWECNFPLTPHVLVGRLVGWLVGRSVGWRAGSYTSSYLSNCLGFDLNFSHTIITHRLLLLLLFYE